MSGWRGEGVEGGGIPVDGNNIPFLTCLTSSEKRSQRKSVRKNLNEVTLLCPRLKDVSCSDNTLYKRRQTNTGIKVQMSRNAE